MLKLTGTFFTVNPAFFNPIVTEPVAVFPLLFAVLEMVYQFDSKIDTFIVEEVQVAVDPVYENFPVNVAIHSTEPSVP